MQFDTLPQNDFVASVSDALRDTVRIFSSETPPPHQLPPLATVLEESSRAATPLALAHTPNYVKDRIVLIGYEQNYYFLRIKILSSNKCVYSKPTTTPKITN